jgi:hypothetical protein
VMGLFSATITRMRLVSPPVMTSNWKECTTPCAQYNAMQTFSSTTLFMARACGGFPD